MNPRRGACRAPSSAVTLGFGLVGVFLGPTLLAVVFRLIEEWSSNGPTNQADSSADEISELPAVPGSATPPHGGQSLGVG